MAELSAGGINLPRCLSLTLVLKDVAGHRVRKLVPQLVLLLLESADRIASDMLTHLQISGDDGRNEEDVPEISRCC